MKEIDKKNSSNNKQSKCSGRTDRKHHESSRKILNGKRIESKSSYAGSESNTKVKVLNIGIESSEVFDDTVIQYMDDVKELEEVPLVSKADEIVGKVHEIGLYDHSTAFEENATWQRNGESNSDMMHHSGTTSGVSRRKSNKDTSRCTVECDTKRKPQIMSHQNNLKKPIDRNGFEGMDNNSEHVDLSSKSSSESSEVFFEVGKDVCNFSKTDKTIRNEDNLHEQGDELVLNTKIEEMEMKIEKLEVELRVVAALEVSLYSVIPEHGSSSHKVHTPARRISRLYIFAYKHWTQDKLATVAKNTVSGLVLIAKSCGNDVPRLTFWLSNIVVLREIIFQTPGNSCHFGNAKRGDGKSSSLKWKRSSSGAKEAQKFDFMQFDDDWQDIKTLTVALEKVEAWIFSRIVESVWWQTLTPNMQSLVDNSSTNKTFGKLLLPALGDQNQGNFSINLWRNAFQEAFQRLCPVRAAGHECGCLPILARLVMEQCAARLDVAMFNAILRESAHEIPTDPVSDPIIEPRVLPIPAGDLSFRSGAQLKNSVGSWSRLLTDLMGIEGDDDYKDQIGNSEPKTFRLLIELSDLLMLPKSLLIDQSIRMEVCPSIGLSLIKRILCNFTPDEFCPDSVPGFVLEALNSEHTVEENASENSGSCFPCTAAPVLYTPPSSMDASKKDAVSGMKSSEFTRNTSMIQKRGYTSDEELEEINYPLTSAIHKLPPSPSTVKTRDRNEGGMSLRYELLLQVWAPQEIGEKCSEKM